METHDRVFLYLAYVAVATLLLMILITTMLHREDFAQYVEDNCVCQPVEQQ